VGVGILDLDRAGERLNDAIEIAPGHRRLPHDPKVGYRYPVHRHLPAPKLQ
jgi:hypothetical protein